MNPSPDSDSRRPRRHLIPRVIDNEPGSSPASGRAGKAKQCKAAKQSRARALRPPAQTFGPLNNARAPPESEEAPARQASASTLHRPSHPGVPRQAHASRSLSHNRLISSPLFFNFSLFLGSSSSQQPAASPTCRATQHRCLLCTSSLPAPWPVCLRCGIPTMSRARLFRIFADLW